MLWLIPAFLTAFLRSLGDVFGKGGLKRNINEYVLAWAFRFFTLPFYLILLFFIQIPELKTGFWIALAINGALNTLTSIFYLKAMKYSDMSLVAPLVALTPLFLLGTSPLILGEIPTALSTIGIFFIVIGSYVLNFKAKSQGALGPFKLLLNDKGARYMLAVAALWSITSNFDKVGVVNSSPLFWAIAIMTTLTFTLTPIMLYNVSGPRQVFKEVKPHLLLLVIFGFLGAATFISQMVAVSLTQVAYVISIKRFSTVLSVFWGFLLFGEKNIIERAAGAVLMVIGVIIIALTA